MLTKRRLTILTFLLVVVAFIFISFGGPSGLLSAIAQNYGAASVSVPVTGCNFDRPSQAVVGSIVSGTAASFAPNGTSPISGISLNPGSKWLVVGLNSTKQYYKIIISCALAWVPVGSIGPSPDAPLAGAPLPTNIVSDSLSTPN